MKHREHMANLYHWAKYVWEWVLWAWLLSAVS